MRIKWTKTVTDTEDEGVLFLGTVLPKVKDQQTVVFIEERRGGVLTEEGIDLSKNLRWAWNVCVTIKYYIPLSSPIYWGSYKLLSYGCNKNIAWNGSCSSIKEAKARIRDVLASLWPDKKPCKIDIVAKRKGKEA